MIHRTQRRARAPYGQAWTILRFLTQLEVAGCIEWPYAIDTRGYGMIQGADGGVKRIHPIVCEWTHGPRPEGLESAHSCGNPRCVAPKHLRWATPTENSADKVRHGTSNHGTRNPLAKLSEADIPVIRERLTNETITDVAKSYGVTHTTISTIKRGLTWRQVA